MLSHAMVWGWLPHQVLQLPSQLLDQAHVVCTQVLDEYAAQRTGAMFVLWFGAVEEEQHGFLELGELVLDIDALP